MRVVIIGGGFAGYNAAKTLRKTAGDDTEIVVLKRNVAASLGYGSHGTYRHHDLGFVVDLGAHQAAANPLHIPLSGLAAKAVTKRQTVQ